MEKTDDISFELMRKVINGGEIDKEEAQLLWKANLESLCSCADKIRESFCGNDFDLCSVLSIKGGRCTENCRFCAQAKCADTEIKSYSLLPEKIVLRAAGVTALHKGIRHFCLVSSGRRLSKKDIDTLCGIIKKLKRDSDLLICGSLGLIDYEDMMKLKEAGLSRIHNNLEVSEKYFEKVCTSHTYTDKLKTIDAAKKAGLEMCCGGIIGVGESIEDRIELALMLRKINPVSVPINILNPVKGTFMGDNTPVTDEEVLRTIAVFRFILPKMYIRLAAGRGYLSDTGIKCFKSGCNATITGNMLTVKGITIDDDLTNISEIGYSL